MENATDAIIMAASVLLLIIALTVSISSFTKLKEQTQQIVSARDKLEIAKDSGGGYLNYLKNDKDVRQVGSDTIITALRRLRKESYTIYIYPKSDSEINFPVDLKSAESSIVIDTVQSQDLELPGEKIEKDRKILRLSLSGESNKYIEDNRIINYIYNFTKGKTFKEYIGIYQIDTGEDVSNVNKATYKIITFVEI